MDRSATLQNMSLRSELTLCNATGQRIKNMQTRYATNHDWEGSTRESQLNQQSLEPWRDVTYTMTINGSPTVHEAKFELTVDFANGDQITIKINQYDAMAPDDNAKKQDSVKEATGNQFHYGVMQRHGRFKSAHRTQYIIVRRWTNDRWMSEQWKWIHNRPLWQYCVLGTHDAGMSKISDHTHFVTSDNTQTQSKCIRKQLEYGVRYFDLRPAVWPSEHGEEVYMGHIQEVAGQIAGGLGESLDEVLQGVKDFYAEPGHEREVAVLKFGSFNNMDPHSFGDDRKNVFKKRVLEALGPLMFKAQPTSAKGRFNVGSVTPEQVVQSGARIICVFSKLDTKKDGKTTVARCTSADGSFKYVDYDNSNPFPEADADCLVYDHYAEGATTWSPVAKDQLAKYGKFDPKGCAPFLFSWTCSEPILGKISTGMSLPGKSIKDGAEDANPYLWFTMWDQIVGGKLTKAKSMNILFADYVGDYLMNDCACAVNAYLAH